MRHESYAWRGGREAVLRMGPDGGPTLLILQPLFEEANRMRCILVEVMRRLADREIATALPDLPGMGDSMVDTVDARLDDWREAARAVIPDATGSIAVRGGALLDGGFRNRWQLAPSSGSRLLRDMVRATALTGDVKASELEARARSEPLQLAGNLIHPALFTALDDAEPSPDSHVAELVGMPWRRAEPGDDPDLVAAMVENIAHWTATCAAR